jgi:hypothetical protein
VDHEDQGHVETLIRKSRGSAQAATTTTASASATTTAVRGVDKMSNDYAVVSALIFALVALVHVVRLIKGWAVQIGPHSISMSVSWVGLVVATLIAIWGFMQLG